MDPDQSKSEDQAVNGQSMTNKKRKYDENNGSGEVVEYGGEENGDTAINGSNEHAGGGGNGLDHDLDNGHHHHHQNGGNGDSASADHDGFNGKGSNGAGAGNGYTMNGGGSGGGGGNKRTQRVITGDNEVFLKLLIPSTVAGGVIGRGGERIAQIQKDTNVKMKMSKALDHYPNTNERVCLIIGSIKSVLRAHDMIVERIQEKTNADVTESGHNRPSGHHRGGSDDEHDRSNQIKLLIPNNTAGLLIGKGGAYIKQIKDESGSFVQISSKQTDLPERIVTIEGDFERRTKALQMVIKKIAEDPSHNSVTNLTYNSNGMHGHSNQGMLNNNNNNHNGGSNNNLNDHHQSSQLGNGNMMSNQNNKYDFNSAATYLAGLSNLALLIINCGGSFQMTSESLKVALRNTGYSSSASGEIIDAITLLMGYGLITKMPPNSNGNVNGNQNNFACNPGLMGGNMNAPGPGFSFMPPNTNMLGGNNSNPNHNGLGRDHHANPSLLNGNNNSNGSMNAFGGSATSLNGVGNGASNGGSGGNSMLPMFANGGGGGGGGYGGNGVVNNGKLKSFF